MEDRVVAVVLILSSLFACTSAIINGTRARDGQYPFMVSLQWDGRHKCGGTLLNRDTILTAAHCYMYIWVNSSEPHRVTALVGNVNSQAMGLWPSKRVGIRKIILPDSLLPFNETQLRTSTFEDDYMLLKTNTTIHPTKTIKYAFINPRRDARFEDHCTIIGWGRNVYPDKYRPLENVFPRHLRKGRVIVIKNEDCDLRRPRPNVLCVSPSVINGQPRGLPCFGDSGSPLVCTDRNGRQFVAGIAIEAAVPCNYPNIPAVYVRVQRIRSWIAQEILRA